MRTPLMLVAVAMLAVPAFGQEKVAAEPSHSITESRPPISTPRSRNQIIASVRVSAIRVASISTPLPRQTMR